MSLMAFTFRGHPLCRNSCGKYAGHDARRPEARIASPMLIFGDRDYYVVESRVVERAALKYVERSWFQPDRLVPLFLHVHDSYSIRSYGENSAQVFIEGQLIASRSMTVFDDFAAADRYFQNTESISRGIRDPDRGHCTYLWAASGRCSTQARPRARWAGTRQHPLHGNLATIQACGSRW